MCTFERFIRTGICFAFVAIAAVSMTGCKGFGSKEPLLGDRGVVPPPYSSPEDAGTGVSVAPPPSRSLEQVELPPLMPPEAGDEELTPLMPEETTGFELPPVPDEALETYTVKKGDTLWDIARLYGISHQELAAYNDMSLDDVLKVGQTLRIPPGGTLVSPEERSAEVRQRTAAPERIPIPAGRKYTVEKGDNLWVIARKFGTSVKKLKQLNELDSDVLHIGQVLVLPKSAGASSATSVAAGEPEEVVDDEDLGEPMTVETVETLEAGGEKTTEQETVPPTDVALPNLLDHTVMEGDDLKNIADMYGTTVEAIKEANPTINSDDDLIPNMKILVPLE
ncbi:MAG: LysM peptidoglycan-binding domain-containing protein [Candidatus Pacebacteria bacterium]|nr:LysM peptidoglycan-binding domain-containing protein [Candidatus Paceibacterota bacterium]